MTNKTTVSVFTYQPLGRSGRKVKTWTAHLKWRDPATGAQKQLKKGGFAFMRDAAAYGEEMKSEIEALGSRASDGTVGGHLRAWSARLVDLQGLKRSTAASYQDKVEYVYKDFGGRVLGEEPLRDLDTDRLEQFYVDLRREGSRTGGPLSARTVQYVATVISLGLKDAQRKKLIAANPARDARKPKARRRRPGEYRIWTPQELHQFYDLTAESWYGPMWRLVGATGIRRGEACGLRWDAVDLDAATIVVRTAILKARNDTYEDDTKSADSDRSVALDEGTVAALKRWRARQAKARLMAGPHWVGEGHVFTQPDGSPMKPDTVSQRFERDVKRHGMPKLSLHGLRHSHGTHLDMAGVRTSEIAERLGHADAAFTARVYVHPAPDHQRGAAEAAARLVADGG